MFDKIYYSFHIVYQAQQRRSEYRNHLGHTALENVARIVMIYPMEHFSFSLRCM
jgi:hypothetical protein